MPTNEDLERVVAMLDAIPNDPAQPAATIVMPPDSGKFIIGNTGGFIRLAIAALKAAQGQKQGFKAEPWFSNEDLDWAVKGLEHDDSAHVYLPSRQTRIQRTINSFWGCTITLLIAVCILVGFVNI